MSNWLYYLRERLKATMRFASGMALICYLSSMEEPFCLFFLFLSLGCGALLLFFYLEKNWARIISLLLSGVFFVLFIVWFRMSISPSAFPELRDRVLWNRCNTQEEKLDYLEHEHWDHDRAVAVYTSMGKEQAMRELNAKVKWGMDRLIPFSNTSVPDEKEYRRYGRLIIDLRESGFLTPASVKTLADQFFVEYPFSGLEEGGEDWEIALAMLNFCSQDCLNQTLLQERGDELPAGIVDYIHSLLEGQSASVMTRKG